MRDRQAGFSGAINRSDVPIVPGRADELGYTFAYSNIDSALAETVR